MLLASFQILCTNCLKVVLSTVRAGTYKCCECGKVLRMSRDTFLDLERKVVLFGSNSIWLQWEVKQYGFVLGGSDAC